MMKVVLWRKENSLPDSVPVVLAGNSSINIPREIRFIRVDSNVPTYFYYTNLKTHGHPIYRQLSAYDDDTPEIELNSRLQLGVSSKEGKHL